MNILQAIDDAALFGPWFRDAATWTVWRAFLAALFGLQMAPDQAEAFAKYTGRTDAPTDVANEAWLICGRRAGKSFMLALIAVFLACFRDYRPYLQPGERGTVIIIAADRKQARTIFRYIRGLLTRVPMLARLIERETADSFDLTNEISIEIGTASFRSSRGYTIVAALADEIAFWSTDDSAANPDQEILDSLRPGMATIPGAMLLCASSPYARRGALHDAHTRYFGKPGDILVWKAKTRDMNPNVPQSLIDRALERDPAAAASEWLAEFRQDISAFVDRRIIESCVDPNEIERPYKASTRYVTSPRYVAFVDPSGGSSDSMTLGIGHRDKDSIIVDVVREIVAPFDPESATEEFAKVLKSYQITTVTGDRYAGEWPRQAFRKRGIQYEPSEQPKNALYTDLLPKLNSRSIRLLDHPRLINQLAALERRTSRGGKDTIDHPPGGHDDVGNVVAGVAACVSNLARSTWSQGPLGI
jgi:hypothetical protein